MNGTAMLDQAAFRIVTPALTGISSPSIGMVASRQLAWSDVDGDDVLFATLSNQRKLDNLRRDPRQSCRLNLIRSTSADGALTWSWRGSRRLRRTAHPLFCSGWPTAISDRTSGSRPWLVNFPSRHCEVGAPDSRCVQPSVMGSERSRMRSDSTAAIAPCSRSGSTAGGLEDGCDSFLHAVPDATEQDDAWSWRTRQREDGAEVGVGGDQHTVFVGSTR